MVSAGPCGPVRADVGRQDERARARRVGGVSFAPRGTFQPPRARVARAAVHGSTTDDHVEVSVVSLQVSVLSCCPVRMPAVPRHKWPRRHPRSAPPAAAKRDAVGRASRSSCPSTLQSSAFKDSDLTSVSFRKRTRRVRRAWRGRRRREELSGNRLQISLPFAESRAGPWHVCPLPFSLRLSLLLPVGPSGQCSEERAPFCALILCHSRTFPASLQGGLKPARRLCGTHSWPPPPGSRRLSHAATRRDWRTTTSCVVVGSRPAPPPLQTSPPSPPFQTTHLMVTLRWAPIATPNPSPPPPPPPRAAFAAASSAAFAAAAASASAAAWRLAFSSASSRAASSASFANSSAARSPPPPPSRPQRLDLRTSNIHRRSASAPSASLRAHILHRHEVGAESDCQLRPGGVDRS